MSAERDRIVEAARTGPRTVAETELGEVIVGTASVLLAELTAIHHELRATHIAIDELRADVGVIGERVLAEPAPATAADRALTHEETRPTPRAESTSGEGWPD